MIIHNQGDRKIDHVEAKKTLEVADEHAKRLLRLYPTEIILVEVEKEEVKTPKVKTPKETK